MLTNIITHRLLKLITLLGVFTFLTGWTLYQVNSVSYAAPPEQGIIEIQGINHQCPDSKEENDTPDAATSLAAQKLLILSLDSGGLVGTHDKDWFTLSLIGGQSFTLTNTLPNDTALTTTEISLYTSTLTADADESIASTRSGQLNWTVPDNIISQTIWLLVRNPYAATQDTFCDAEYQTVLDISGSALNNDKTSKTGQTGSNRIITYTVSLYNYGNTPAQVVVKDPMPEGVTLQNVTVSPAEATNTLLTNTTALTWTGEITPLTPVELTLVTVADEVDETFENIVWIEHNNTVFTRTSGPIVFPPQASENPKIYLPIIIMTSISE